VCVCVCVYIYIYVGKCKAIKFAVTLGRFSVEFPVAGKKSATYILRVVALNFYDLGYNFVLHNSLSAERPSFVCNISLK
jgi:hypothetical protein